MQENWIQVLEADQWVIMGYIYDGQLEMAFDKIQRRLELGRDIDISVYKVLARCLIEFGEVDVAMDVLKTAVRKGSHGWQNVPWEYSDDRDREEWRRMWYELLRTAADERNVSIAPCEAAREC